MDESDILILKTQISILKEKIEYLRAILDCSRDIIVTTDKKTNVVEFNKGAELILGYKKQEVIEKSAEDLYFNKEERKKLIERLKKEGGHIEKEIVGKTKDGRRLDLSLTLAELRDKKGNVIGTVGVAKDISKRKELERELHRLSITDELTGLYNHGYFWKRLKIESELVQKTKMLLFLMLFDLDKFKDYNDDHGHLEGDKILSQIGKIIKSNIRKDKDSAFRYGGDEFTMILKDIDLKNAHAIAERIRSKIEDQRFGGITASIGLCRFKDGMKLGDFVRTADRAMYKAKNTGKNKVVELDVK